MVGNNIFKCSIFEFEFLSYTNFLAHFESKILNTSFENGTRESQVIFYENNQPEDRQINKSNAYY